MNVWIYAGAIAVAIAGTYILWGPSSRPKRKRKDFIPGLVNLGNSCFLNCILQALASCTSIIAWVQKATDYASESLPNKDCLLVRSLLSILTELNVSEESCNGAEVIKALREHHWIISAEEQDAHELFHVLTTTVEEELLPSNPVLSLLDANKLEEGGNEPRKTFVSSAKTLPAKIASPMRGLLVNELKCTVCNYKYPARYDTFDSLSLVIPLPNWGQLSLQDLLLKFIACEFIQDVACSVCSKMDKSESQCKTTFTKQLSFGKLPHCLCIHIQRTMWLKNGLTTKCYDYISFPEVLAMDHFIHFHNERDKQMGANYTRLRLIGGNARKSEGSSGSSFYSKTPDWKSTLNIPTNMSKEEYLCSYNYVYLLHAVIVHLGDTLSGHFITYRRRADRWFCTSDLEVKEVAFAEVSRSCAYMLFYEKIK